MPAQVWQPPWGQDVNAQGCGLMVPWRNEGGWAMASLSEKGVGPRANGNRVL